VEGLESDRRKGWKWRAIPSGRPAVDGGRVSVPAPGPAGLDTAGAWLYKSRPRRARTGQVAEVSRFPGLTGVTRRGYKQRPWVGTAKEVTARKT